MTLLKSSTNDLNKKCVVIVSLELMIYTQCYKNNLDTERLGKNYHRSTCIQEFILRSL